LHWWWWLGICSYHASQCWHHVTSSQFNLKSSPCIALENWVLHNMSCTWRKRTRKEKNITIRLSKQKLVKINSRIKLSKKKQLWKINPIDKKLHHLEVTDGVFWDKVLCKESSSKESRRWCGHNQSVCSQVLVRQISQLAQCSFRGFINWWKLLLPVLLAASALLTCSRTTLSANL
jgi:hypothetical protein